MISIHFQGKQFNIWVIQVYANAKEAEGEQFYEDLQYLVELTPKKYVHFIIGDRNTKVGSQETDGVAGMYGLGVQNEAKPKTNRILPRNPLVIENILLQQHKRWLTLHIDINVDGQYQNQIDYILCSQRWRSSK